ncbi:DUF4232 domain-containing protein [Streptomyces resistomycificus]|uniref:Lipoprotein n=1 Tax=Streptomyces resistomycificus TaxID=67356 RepID=A0A0L8KX30_9ACTN|nr:DUF4232 domain-containing protein [Streptomyces resistomycificus]KOG30513.1 lipoprotein [Streptomyces resistomycificus]KUO02128.1 hypothetical protein AQJ84_00195 [Streptomyces resistomycificus]
MRRAIPLLPVLVAAVVLTTGCGSERAGSQNTGAGASPQATFSDPGLDGVRVTGLTGPTPAGDTSGLSAAYEVANDSAETLTYTVLFDFTTAAGEVMTNLEQTVRDVGPARTVRRTVEMPPLAPGVHDVTRVKVSRVTSVPAAEAPADPGDCPSSGVRITTDEGDAAMGLRVVGLWLENCGTADYRVEGYPQLTVLGEDRKPVDGVRILKGGGGLSGTGSDDPPRPVTLKPGERARAGLTWRNTTEAGLPAVNAPYVRVRAKSGAAPVLVTPHLDLGSTGKLGVGPWTAEGR